MILLLDTASLLYRAFHALPELTTSTGEPTGALYGFGALLVKLLREQRPEGLAFALDARGPTFRHERFAGYKASRGRVPEALRRQRERLGELLDALGAPRHRAPGFEADDVLATLARELAERGRDACIVSGDRDLFQTVGPRTTVLFVGRRQRDHVLYDEARVEARYGLSASELPSLTALVGDPADDLPGVPGVGPKTAARWIRAFGDVSGLLAHLDEAKPARLRDAVRARAAKLRLDEDLAKLRADVPLGDGPRFAPVTPDALARLRAFFASLEMRTLAERLDDLAG
jgi:DNA polymerase-1